MATFGRLSRERLATCHPDLIRLFEAVVAGWDCTVLEGHRGEREQNLAFANGTSKLQWPNGAHNSTPSRAVDVAPYPIGWKDTNRFYAFGGYVKGVASQLRIPIRWGGDWDGDNDLGDQKFNDLVHFELLR